MLRDYLKLDSEDQLVEQQSVINLASSIPK